MIYNHSKSYFNCVSCILGSRNFLNANYDCEILLIEIVLFRLWQLLKRWMEMYEYVTCMYSQSISSELMRVAYVSYKWYYFGGSFLFCFDFLGLNFLFLGCLHLFVSARIVGMCKDFLVLYFVSQLGKYGLLDICR